MEVIVYMDYDSTRTSIIVVMVLMESVRWKELGDKMTVDYRDAKLHAAINCSTIEKDRCGNGTTSGGKQCTTVGISPFDDGKAGGKFQRMFRRNRIRTRVRGKVAVFSGIMTSLAATREVVSGYQPEEKYKIENLRRQFRGYYRIATDENIGD